MEETDKEIRPASRRGEPGIWICGSALALCLCLMGGLLVLVLSNGLGFFWPKDLVLFTLTDGSRVLGQSMEREAIPRPDDPSARKIWRVQVKRANRDLEGADFIWIDEAAIAGRESPPAAVALERSEWGDFFGFLKEVREEGRMVASGAEAWAALEERLPAARRLRSEIRRLETVDIGAMHEEGERLRLRLRRLETAGESAGLAGDRLRREIEAARARFEESQRRLADLRARQTAVAVMATASGGEKEVPLASVLRAWTPNSMGVLRKAGSFAARFWEFVSDDPRESNTEGGVFPAIFGTVLMVVLMSLLVTPLGVVAALYLREYARQGPVVSAVRIAVNNLAGVPSIVFGVFGVGFFIYLVGGTIDQLFFSESLPSPTFGTGGILWASLTLALLTVPVQIVATEEGLASIPGGVREASLALGATRFETTWRVVLPAVAPSILTGLILAMARAAGEVAPLMITGVVKLAPALPIDSTWPFLHAERKFMHLGFHIYDVGFQSPNVDSARPMVYMTTLLLVTIVLVLNLTAILLRNRLARKFRTSGV